CARSSRRARPPPPCGAARRAPRATRGARARHRWSPRRSGAARPPGPRGKRLSERQRRPARLDPTSEPHPPVELVVVHVGEELLRLLLEVLGADPVLPQRIARVAVELLLHHELDVRLAEHVLGGALDVVVAEPPLLVLGQRSGLRVEGRQARLAPL